MSAVLNVFMESLLCCLRAIGPFIPISMFQMHDAHGRHLFLFIEVLPELVVNVGWPLCLNGLREFAREGVTVYEEYF